jgi:hypothetical protein
MRTLAGRTVAQLLCLALGLGIVLSGTLGLLSVLDTELAHDAVHLVSGVLLMAGGLSRRGASGALVAFGLLYAALALSGRADGAKMAGVIAINPVDNVLHAGLSVAALAGGLAAAVGARRGAQRDTDAPTAPP